MKVTSEEVYDLIDRLDKEHPGIFDRAWEDMSTEPFIASGQTVLDAVISLARALEDDEDKEADPQGYQIREISKKLDRLSAEVEELKRHTKKGFWK